MGVLKRWPGAGEENPRWTACRAALGREPEGWEFINWIQARWREFMADRPGFRHQWQAEFDEWLRANPHGLPF